MSRTPEQQAQRYNDFLRSIIPTISQFDFCDKDRCVSQHVAYMIDRTRRMFRWSGLPDTVPERMLELYLQLNGNCAWYQHDGNLYVYTGGLGGEPDEYYRPTIYTIANPAQRLSVMARIGVECVVMPNDSMFLGMLPLYSRYATAITETEISLRLATINTRIVELITASDDRTKESALNYLKDIEDGKPGVIAEARFIEGLKDFSVHPYATSGSIQALTDLIETEQYWKASWFNEIGLNANYNMKREAINLAESQMNDDALLPLVDDMLRCRQQAAEEVNAMFGTNISVELASSWEDNQAEIDLAHKQIDSEDDSDPIDSEDDSDPIGSEDGGDPTGSEDERKEDDDDEDDSDS